MPRPRKPGNVDTPNLYESGGYYTWRHPLTGKRYGIGRHRQDAIAQAHEANQHIAPQDRLSDRIVVQGRSIAAFLPIYRTALETRDLSTATRYGRKSHLKAIEKHLGDVAIGPRQEDAAEITRRCSVMLRSYEKADKQRMAKAIRGTLVDLFSEMAACGWLVVNPASVLRVQGAEVRRARLTLDDYVAIHKASLQLHPWVPRSIELALVSLQRREDVAPMRFTDVRDGRLHVVQRKTGARLRIPVALRLDAVGLTLDAVRVRCRDNVVSRFLLHHELSHGQAKAGEAVHIQTLTGAFAEARKIAGIKVEDGRTPPTFHELRSLGARLYTQQGYDPQNLLGHKDAQTTAIYQDNRGAEWIDVAA